MPYTVLSHTADTGIEACAESLEDLIAEMALGMFSLMVEQFSLRASDELRVRIEARSREDLVVDVLSELLYRFEVGEVIPTSIRVSIAGRNAATVAAAVVPMAGVEMIGPPIKAVTYHDLVIDETNEGWYGRVYFDV